MTYQGYLDGKKPIDDRSLNRNVFETLRSNLDGRGELKVLELGSGIGTMVARGLEWGLLDRAEYTAVDLSPENAAFAPRYLGRWGASTGYRVERNGHQTVELSRDGQRVRVRLCTADALKFVSEQKEKWDLLIAHSFLDLIDVSSNLGSLLGLLRPGGMFYFSLVFDGLTALRPAIDPEWDERIMCTYHRNMDRRTNSSKKYRSCETGRQVLDLLTSDSDVDLLSAGSSDWTVCPRSGSYTDEERAFLKFILQTMFGALKEEGEEEEVLRRWLELRYEHIDSGKLIYIAHQIDMVGSVRGQ